MATSSIFANFVIRGEEAAKQFANAMEECEKTPEWTPKIKVPLLLTDHDAIREHVAKTESNCIENVHCIEAVSQNLVSRLLQTGGSHILLTIAANVCMLLV